MIFNEDLSVRLIRENNIKSSEVFEDDPLLYIIDKFKDNLIAVLNEKHEIGNGKLDVRNTVDTKFYHLLDVINRTYEHENRDTKPNKDRLKIEYDNNTNKIPSKDITEIDVVGC